MLPNLHNTCRFSDEQSMKLYKVNFILKITGRRKYTFAHAQQPHALS